jgi:hypothetical protein
MYHFFSVDPYLFSCILGPSLLCSFYFLPFSVLLLFVSGRLRIWRGVVEEPLIFLVLFKGSFKDPRYCSLVLFKCTQKARVSRRIQRMYRGQ